ncbi:conserved hypothetical protein [Cellulomonas flavigena DSM 20109]|uniref:Lipoprotein n=1 Tax=Cellulomonas flavigena (strain ATCC 482 / DSM 20109 / BCRC 11376 / JCM 18109 / NBRC 3775 / NCIMB 8073 / NRS 134) TaxID=446466 RepID=D5UFR4_CELFN|nr:hypothetical protein [Cellulomonas flavigena]ADG73023.1 conserved hypothetical protein [Cellulomonas flavigena DSM 20109]
MTNLHHWCRVVGAAALGLVSAAALTACAGPASSDDEPAPTGRFTGPWAAEFAAMNERFPSEFADAALADSVITEQEMLEGRGLVESCYTAAGYTVTFDEYGRAAVTDPDGAGDSAPQAMGGCSSADGGVMILYYMVAANPENEDEMAIRAECLVEAGVVEQGFTGEDLQKAYDSAELPWPTGDEVAQRCLLDPKGMISTTGTDEQ